MASSSSAARSICTVRRSLHTKVCSTVVGHKVSRLPLRTLTWTAWSTSFVKRPRSWHLLTTLVSPCSEALQAISVATSSTIRLILPRTSYLRWIHGQPVWIKSSARWCGLSRVMILKIRGSRKRLGLGGARKGRRLGVLRRARCMCMTRMITSHLFRLLKWKRCCTQTLTSKERWRLC